MIPLYTPAQVRAMDAATIDGGTPAAVLMERAAGHLARTVTRAAGRSYGMRVLFVCGKGNNAGDGIGAARRLRAAGADARIHLVLGDEGLTPETAEQLRQYRAGGGREDAGLRLAGTDVVVDCLLGTGSSGEPREPLAGVIDAINRYRAATPDAVVVACDIPSGIDADAGGAASCAVQADITLTVGAHKRGLWLWPARGRAGRIECADIGITDHAPEAAAEVLEDADAARVLAPAAPDVDKRGRGVVVVLAGSEGMSGAATMVARGALETGVGLLTVATAAPARDVVAAAVPEAMTLALAADPDAAFATLEGALSGADVLAVGPGLGHAAETVALVRRIVREVQLPLVLDADGLNAFRGEGDLLAEHAAAELICTPHAREFARLLAGDVEDLWPRRLEEVAKAARRWRSTVVAKGPGTLIGLPDGRTWINPTGTAALATGGTGDVLTGIVAATRSATDVPEAVAAAIYLHGRAGEIAARRRPPRSVAALDVAAAIPAALASLDNA